MRIALDYDLTYSIDPAFWQSFAGLAAMAGHDVRIVTFRDARLDRTTPLIEAEKIVPVIYTGGIAKRWFCEHFGDGFLPDVWIDDRPESVLGNSTATPDFLVEWRATRGEE